MVVRQLEREAAMTILTQEQISEGFVLATQSFHDVKARWEKRARMGLDNDGLKWKESA